jgi:phosphate transport system substrate-binding protein
MKLRCGVLWVALGLGALIGMSGYGADGATLAVPALGADGPEAVIGAFPVRQVSAEFPLETFPRLDSSTSAQPLAVLIGCRLTGLESRWLGAEGDRLLFPVALQHADEPADAAAQRVARAQALNERIQHTGTNTAYVALIEGRQDLILVARAPSADELEQARGKGVELDVRPAALDAFVFMVNKTNPVAGLTTAQIRDIYTGKITNWKDVGGPDQELHPYARERNSGSQELMETLVLKGAKMTGVHMPIVASMVGPFRRLAEDKLALAYTVFFYAEHMAPRENTRLLAVDSVMPTTETIRTHQYPYVAECFTVVRKDAQPQSPALRLRDWLLGPTGQEVVAESGYVPVVGPTEHTP